ncbi:MAG: hypothetical protein DWP97_06045 [Calditrichaeota bacterium]|nr:MAG: hypothetical protein DWP97_06045 [Calditrichota bacterium]
MAKKQSFSDKSSKKSHTMTCPTCGETLQFIKFVGAKKGKKDAWKFRDENVGVCKCNTAEIYG